MAAFDILDAIKQMIVHCELKEVSYEFVSARSVLYELGFNEKQADIVIDSLASRGFSYCLDPRIPNRNHANERPPMDACYWGPDQLKSRLRCTI